MKARYTIETEVSIWTGYGWLLVEEDGYWLGKGASWSSLAGASLALANMAHPWARTDMRIVRRVPVGRRG